MPEVGRTRPVRHLQELYTVVVGLALAVAITNLIDQDAEVPLRVYALPYFAAYLVTLVPFYHGALRHLDITYLEDTTGTPRSGALMIDWSLLFIESCVLLTLAILVRRPGPFTYTLLALLLFDAVWAFAAHLAFSPALKKHRAENRWAVINLVTAFSLVLAVVFLDSLDSTQKPVGTYRWVLVVAITVGRTIWDYSWCWSYYYPSDGEKAT